MRAIRAAAAYDGRRFLPGGATVLLDGDRIAAVETGRVDLPDGVEVTTYDGTLLPGLVDCHTHLVADATVGGLERVGTMSDEAIDAVVERSLRAHVAAGVTTVRDLGDRGYRTLGFRARTGLPRVVAAGPPLTTPGGHCHFLGGVVDDVRTAVAEHVDRGVDVVKVMASGGFATPETDQTGAQFTRAQLRELVEAAHVAGLPVLAHAHSLVGAENALAAGVDGIEHFTCLTTDGLRIDDALLDEIARRGVRIDVTMGSDRALIAQLPALPAPLAALMERAGFASFDAFYAFRIGTLTRFRDHGVSLVSGVDSGMAPMKAHGNVWRAVVELMEAGYPVAEALSTATSEAAAACGLAEVTGLLAPGLAADLLVVDGDVRQDVTALAAPVEVVVRGERIR